MIQNKLNLDLLDDSPEDEIPPTDPKSGQSTHHATSHANEGQPDPAGALAWCLDEFSLGAFPLTNRNNWMTAFALFCNERGVPREDLEAHALQHYEAVDFDADEIRQVIQGNYSRKQANHGSKSYTGAHRRVEAAPAPPVPADLYDELPDYLRRCCAPFESHEQAVMLLATLAVLSGCFPGVGGIYAQRDFGLNLFVFIMAQAASGKGSAAWAQALARSWHKRLTAESAAALAEHEAEIAAHKVDHKGKGANPSSPPTPPPRRMLYIPGNTSSAAILAQLAENGSGGGIIFETEADTLTTSLGGEHGKFGDSLRKIAQHEPISVLRKADRQHLDIERPALSIFLTGTPGQLPRLMPNAEDGLVSRFLFYSFSQAPVWRDVSPRAGKSLGGYFAPLANELTRMIEAMPLPDEVNPYPVQIVLSTADWERINAAGAAGLVEAVSEAGTAGGSTAFRLGLIAWRITGILTVLRCFENGEAPGAELEADPRDVTTALRIMDTARAHALHVLSTLPAAPTVKSFTRHREAADNREKAHELKKQGLSIRAIADKLGVPKSTVESWLKAA